MKFSAFADAFERSLRRGGYSSNTVTSYTYACRTFSTFLTTQGLNDEVRHFTGSLVKRYADELDVLGAKASTVTRYLSALSSLARFGMQTEIKNKPGRYLLDEDPTKRFQWPLAQEPETDYLHGDELAAILGLPLESHQAVARDLLIETGLRASELCGANIGDLQELSGHRVLRVITKGRRSRERKKSVPLSDRLWAFLHETIPVARRVEPEAPIIVGERGQRLTRTAFGQMVARWGRDAGITRLRVHPHLFRHTAAVIAKLGAIDSRTTSALLTHANSSTLRRYDHIVPGELHTARDRWLTALDRFVMPPSSTPDDTHGESGGRS